MKKQDKESLIYTIALVGIGMILWFSAWFIRNT